MLYSKEKLKKLQTRWETSKGKILLKTIKEGRCYLSNVFFGKKISSLAESKDISVKNHIDLRGTVFSGFDFRIAIKEEDEGFSENMAILNDIHFEGATLRHCNFEDGKIHNCNFEDADLTHCNFKNSTLSNCDFRNGDLTGVNLIGAKLVNCNFENATIRDVGFNSTNVDEKTNFGKALKSEKEKDFETAAIEYKQIKEMYKSCSLHLQADQTHYKEMVCKRKQVNWKNPRRILNYIFGDLLCKYGTSFGRVLMWSAAVIVLAAFLNTFHDSLIYHNKPIDATFGDALYFSIVSFTTLGYGDFQATGFMRYIAGLEGFMGASLMSLFTVIVARKIIRD